MNLVKQLLIITIIMMLGACASAPQQPIAFNASAISGAANRVVIQMNKIPETNTTFPGAGCLLCIGVARAAHSALTTQVQSLQPEELSFLPGRLTEVLSRSGAQVKVLDQSLDIDSLSSNSEKGDNPTLSDKDFRPLSDKLKADKLLVIDIHNQGVLRPYSAYIPTAVPKAYVSGTAYMVDLKTNNYIWYSPIHITKPAEGAWNEPPNFPGLTNAYYQVLAETLDSLVSELSNNLKPRSNDNSLSQAVTR